MGHPLLSFPSPRIQAKEEGQEKHLHASSPSAYRGGEKESSISSIQRGCQKAWEKGRKRRGRKPKTERSELGKEKEKKEGSSSISVEPGDI